jgi:hypothetical protein
MKNNITIHIQQAVSRRRRHSGISSGGRKKLGATSTISRRNRHRTSLKGSVKKSSSGTKRKISPKSRSVTKTTRISMIRKEKSFR